MSHQITFERKGNYLHAIVTGDNTLPDIVAYLTHVARECAERNCYRVLIEERLKGPRLTMTEVLNLVAGASASGLGRLPTVAFVDLEATGPLMPLAADLAASYGINVWNFATVAEAEAWLNELDDPPS